MKLKSTNQRQRTEAAPAERGPIATAREFLLGSPTTRRPRAARRSLSRARTFLLDQEGATMVMGVFIAALLVGMIYYVWGIGDAIMHRERMQDAADTAVFSTAVIHARGMNMIALLNVIMSALAVVAATMATIASMIGWAFGGATTVCGFCIAGGSGCWACPYAAAHGIQWNSARNTSSNVTDAVEALMTGLSGYSTGIRYGVVAASHAKAVQYGTEVYRPVTDWGVMAPVRLSLPVQDDETNWPCDEKVLPGVRVLSPVFVWLFGSSSVFMLGGIVTGELVDAPRHSRAWCDDGYFQRVTDDARTMGNDEYQIQVFMGGDPDRDWTAEGVAVATWGDKQDADEAYGTLLEAGRISFAQAEFFYDDDESDWREWMWHMNWRARLRRFRVSATGGGLLNACAGNSGCGALGNFANQLDDLVVH